MTRRAAFGDFAASVTQHLRRLQWPTAPSAAGERANAADGIADLSRAVHALAGYAKDVSGVLDAEYLTGDRELGAWVRAATRVRQALETAEAALPAAPSPEEAIGASRPRGGRGDLRAATRSMTLGRDLLHTHATTQADLVTASGSEWTPVVFSAPVACAILHEVGGWARQIAGHAYRISATASCPAAQRRKVSSIGKTLSQVSWAIGEAQERRPVRQGQLRLLHAIPVKAVPAQCLPASGDSVANLNIGVISTAERLRTAAWPASAEPPWSRQLTRETLRQTAGCCAISASNIQIMLTTLATDHGKPYARFSGSLAEAANAADRARAAWMTVTESWDSITTDTRGPMGEAGTEAAALALWTGRLAYANPHWTPDLGPRHPPRPACEFAGDTDHLRYALDAAHHVWHTLAEVADSDRRNVRSASMTGRLIVPTRSLPDGYDIPYRFAPALPSSTAPLLSSYDQALQTSTEATAAMAGIVAYLQADSRVITTARAAARADPSAWAGAPIREMPTDLGGSHGRSSQAGSRDPQMVPPGPVERVLIELDITSKPDLEQAAAIDKAADQLILRAATRPAPSQPDRDLGRSPGSAELIGHLIATNGSVLSALRPHQPSARQAEFEAGG